MTLSSRIAGLTSASREIDAEIADLLGWWPSTRLESSDAGGYRRFYSDRDVIQCPNYTANIMHVFDECDKRGWFKTIDDTNFKVVVEIWPTFRSKMTAFDWVASVSRKDYNITLAACEALVLAVENNANGA